jgi:hypothetical protein
MKRKIDFREPREKILIVCEGERTEPNYFNAFKAKNDNIIIDIKGTGYNTCSLVKEAIKLKTEAEKKEEPYNQVWCVFDKDSFADDLFNNAIFLAQKNKIKTAYSNQAFEVWYLLHFSYFVSALHRNVYIEKLDGFLCKKYKKNDPDMYDLLIDKQKDAIRNAKKLINNYKNKTTYSKKDPSTQVYLLVEELNKFI